MRTITCKCGENKTIDKGIASVGDIFLHTGFQTIFTLDAECIHLCPSCWTKAKEYAVAMHQLLKKPYISIDQFLEGEIE